VIVDSSVILAIASREVGFRELLEKLAAAPSAGIGVPTLVESGIVLKARLAIEPVPFLDRFLRDFDVVPIPFVDEHWREALRAFTRFGRGRHRAALNFGDCLTYAVAHVARQPLLSTGDDFPRTDLELA